VLCDPERCANITWTTNTVEIRAPARNATNSGARSAAAIYTKDPAPTFQTMFADIIIKGTHDYTLALYFVDWDDSGRRVGVQIIDPDTLKQLATVQVVRDYHDGRYLVYKYNKSVRVRVDTIKKPNATLSGIFFSPG
jgi:alpha-L-rhamnosidase